MNRRFFLFSLLGLSGAALVSTSRLRAQPNARDVDNPYADVNWDECRFVHSMSHQHTGRSDEAMQSFTDMGYRHVAFSNYYPSAPTYPLSAAFLAKNPDAIGCPNAEHHSFLDTNLHANALGSLLETGYGKSLSASQIKQSPIVAHFENLTVFNAAERPGAGVYRLDITTSSLPGGNDTSATLSIDGATECVLEEGFAAKGEVRERSLPAVARHFYLRATAPKITATLNYDATQTSVSQFRLMQGSNRPWREVFRAALDGEAVNGRREGGLQYANGGGITLNHPTGTLAEYSAMLDFDARVLGIEVWNQLTSGFGSSRGFYDTTGEPTLYFYKLWDEILKSGRRCLGFFVKDHLAAGRGRNVLLMPEYSSLSMPERELAALRAYRSGAFFGSIAAPATDENGNVAAPFDYSAFRFSRIVLRRDGNGKPSALEVAVSGNDAVKRPNIQIRFITENGVEQIADAARAEYAFAARPNRKFVRVEAFAYPSTHNGGEPLTKDAFGKMSVYEISLVHDKRASGGPTFFGKDQEFPARVPIADMIFSQPIRFLA